MCSQNICPRGCKVTLVAFIWLFSTVFYQMCPQTVCPRGCIVTLVAFVWLFSIVCVSNVSSNYLPERMHSHIGCICLAFLHCAFSNVSSNCLPVRIVYLYLSLCVVPFPSMNNVMVGLKMWRKKIFGAGLKSVPRGPKHSNKKSRKIPGFQFWKSRDFGWLQIPGSRDSRDPARACR